MEQRERDANLKKEEADVGNLRSRFGKGRHSPEEGGGK